MPQANESLKCDGKLKELGTGGEMQNQLDFDISYKPNTKACHTRSGGEAIGYIGLDKKN